MGSSGIHQDMSLLLARREERAFERLYRRHVGDVYRYALVVLKDPQDAESVTQATFVNAYRQHKRGSRPRKAHNWLLAIAHDVCSRRSGPDPRDEPFEDETMPTPSDVRRALEELGFDERTALTMREVECRSYAEIAELLDLEDGEVEALIFRARKAFREQLEGSLSCHQAERAISRSLDGRLPRAERRILSAHLESCSECTEFDEAQRSHREALRSFERAPLPVTLRPPNRGSRRAVVLARATAIAAIALVAGGVVAGGVDPRQWGHDATEVEPAGAAPQKIVKRTVAPRVEKLARESSSPRR
jgi:RNA polymerase sigma-70 factor, ECF subfamily